MRTFLNIASCFAFLLWLWCLLIALATGRWDATAPAYLIASLVAAGFAAVLERIDAIHPPAVKSKKVTPTEWSARPK